MIKGWTRFSPSGVAMTPELVTSLLFGLGSLYFAWTDARRFQVPFVPLAVWAGLLLVVQLVWPRGDWGLRLAAASLVLGGGGALWLVLRRRLGLADVFFVTVMALAFEAWVVYFALVGAVTLGLVFYVQFWLRFGTVGRVRLPFVPLLVLGLFLVLMAKSSYAIM